MRVYVASFSPADDLAATGGFEWRPDYEDAAALIREWLDHPPIHNIALIALDVPDGVTREEVTAWIDDRLYLIEPAGNHGKEATMMRE